MFVLVLPGKVGEEGSTLFLIIILKSLDLLALTGEYTEVVLRQGRFSPVKGEALLALQADLRRSGIRTASGLRRKRAARRRTDRGMRRKKAEPPACCRRPPAGG